MLSVASIWTERLELIPATSEILMSDLHGNPHLCRILNAGVPATWPPDHLTEDVLREFIRIDADKTDPYFSMWYWILHNTEDGIRTLIGSGGTMSSASSEGTVVIGYGVLDEYQGQGYATEAVRHLVRAIFEMPDIARIIATTHPELHASVRVLEKNGFSLSQQCPDGCVGMEEGTLCYERRRVTGKTL